MRPQCPESHDECAGFLCIPKRDDANAGNCPKAIIDIIQGKGNEDIKKVGGEITVSGKKAYDASSQSA